MHELEHHDEAWNDRLQDLLDGDVSRAERADIESHVATCPRCRLRFVQLKRLDGKLAAHLGAPRLDAAFDRQVLARINALDARKCEQARRQADREFREHMQALTRAWRWGMACLAAGVVAAIALILAIITWSERVDIASRLAALVNDIGLSTIGPLHTVLTLLIAAAVGGGVAKWVADTYG